MANQYAFRCPYCGVEDVLARDGEFTVVQKCKHCPGSIRIAVSGPLRELLVEKAEAVIHFELWPPGKSWRRWLAIVFFVFVIGRFFWQLGDAIFELLRWALKK